MTERPADGAHPDVHDEPGIGSGALTGLALSGGGIRSASYCLGVLQALAKHDKLRRFDYLSAVSGGSWIAASVSWFWSRHGRADVDEETGKKYRFTYGLGNDDFPYNVKEKFSHRATGSPLGVIRLRGRDLTSWLRSRAKILTPGSGADLSVLLAMILRATIINLLVFVPISVFVMWSLRSLLIVEGGKTALGKGVFAVLPWIVGDSGAESVREMLPRGEVISVREVYIALLLSFVVITIGYAILSRMFVWFGDADVSMDRRKTSSQQRFRARQAFNSLTGKLLTAIGMATVLASLPAVSRMLPGATDAFGGYKEIGSMLASGVGGGLAYFGSTADRKAEGWQVSLRRLAAPLGSALLIYAALFLVYSLASSIFMDSLEFTWRPGWLPVGGIIVVAALALIPNVNHNSLHRFYRDRLMEAFLPNPTLSQEETSFSDRFPFSQIQPIKLPVKKEKQEAEGIYGPGAVIAVEPRYIKARRHFARYEVDVDSDSQGAADGEPTAHLNFNARLMKSRLGGFIRAVWRHEDMDKEREGNHAAPYLLINATLTTTSSKDRKLRTRGYSHFLFSSTFVGSDATGYVPTATYANDELTLATAIAISGAAVDPNTAATRARSLSFLMALLNVRTGYWGPNPNPKHQGVVQRQTPSWIRAIGGEMLNLNVDETRPFIHLSDGGHSENLGIYELIRRRCKVIVGVDAGQDPDWEWSDLGRLVRQARVDFGVDIRPVQSPSNNSGGDSGNPLLDIKPKESNEWSYDVADRAWIVFAVEYPEERDGKKKDGETKDGVLILLKTSMLKGVDDSAVHAYKLKEKTFPDQTTLNQFFTEEQFEAYRELGFQTASRMMADSEVTKAVPFLATTAPGAS